MKIRQENEKEKNNFMSLIEGKTSAINSLKEELDRMKKVHDADQARIKKLV